MMKQIANKHTKAKTLIAKSSIQINNTVDEAWKALVDPEIVAKYMLGSQQVSDWQIGRSLLARLPGLIVPCFGRFWVRGLRSQMRGTWAPISLEEHTSIGTQARRQSQNPLPQKSFAIPADLIFKYHV